MFLVLMIDKVLIKSLYQSATEFSQSINGLLSIAA